MSARVLTIALLALALVAAGCGGDDEGKPIPASTAAALSAQLDGVQGRLDNGSAGACKDILEGPRGPNLEQVKQIIDSMPDDVDADVRSALQDSFDNLWDRVQDKCDELSDAQQPTETNTTPTETTPPETTPTETTPTETTPPATEELPPEGDGNGNGNGNGGVPSNGNGNGTGGTGVGGGISPDGANLGGGE